MEASNCLKPSMASCFLGAAGGPLVVERGFAWIGQNGRNRRMSKDDAFLPTTSETWVYLSMLRLMLKRLAHEQV